MSAADEALKCFFLGENFVPRTVTMETDMNSPQHSNRVDGTDTNSPQHSREFVNHTMETDTNSPQHSNSVDNDTAKLIDLSFIQNLKSYCFKRFKENVKGHDCTILKYLSILQFGNVASSRTTPSP
jgi:hypothetical protein